MSSGDAPLPAEAAERGVAALPLWGRGGVVRGWALIDADDHEDAGRFRWFLHHRGYVFRNVARGRVEWLHRRLTGVQRREQEVDHRNGDPLDNRRGNLRVTTRAGNAQNVAAKGRSRFRGVAFHRQSGRWRARCQIAGRMHYLGYFATEEDAGAAAAAFRAERLAFSRN